MDARLILDPPAPGAWNMAVDEALFQEWPQSGLPVLRFYRWSEPTLSLGYFQPIRARDSHPASHSLPVVRRTTGGGAIVHDRELTYSLIVPLEREHPDVARNWVESAHETLVQVLGGLGLPARRWPDDSALPPEREPFLCFQRRSQNDVVIGEIKVAGSAQRRLRRVVLQHGSVLLQRSDFAPELPGIPWPGIPALKSVAAGRRPGEQAREQAGEPGPSNLTKTSAYESFAEHLAEKWAEQLGQVWSMDWTRAYLSSNERQTAEKLEREKFNADSWTRKR